MVPGRKKSQTNHPLIRTLLVLALSVCVSLIISRLGVGSESIIMVFLLGVLFSTILTNGYVYGVAASVISVILFNFFFTEPRYTLLVYRAIDVMLLLFFLVTAIVSGTITSRLQRQMSISHQSELTARLLYEVSEGFLQVTGISNIAMRGIKYIFDHTGLKNSISLEGGDEVYGQTEADGTAEHGAFSVPIKNASRQIGEIQVFGARDELSFRQELVIKTVAAQLGTALDREYSYREREEIRVAMERERLRSMLLRSVAHDLRSPLTALTGASALLSDEFDRLPEAERKKLASDISDEMIWLTNLVENILNMTRIGENQLVLHKEHEVVDDVVNQAVSHMSRIIQNRPFDVLLPEEVISVEMDGKLIVQVIINLLDNAIKHTPPGSGIALKASVTDNSAVFEVSDKGAGLDEEAMNVLFKGRAEPKNYVVDARRGMGMGLVICRAIVEAHGGKIWAENIEGGGAKFAFSLPAEGAEHGG